MDDKARSKPMRNILDRLLNNGPFEAIIFGDKCILDEACDFFISFFSKGFPLHKAIEYVKLRTPFCVNEVDLQTLLWDRRLVLEVLEQIGVPTPKRLTMSRDGGPMLEDRVRQKLKLRGVNLLERRPIPEFNMIDQDTIQIGDQIITKPFVEKPVSGEDHNIHIYYHSSTGGGARRLFRKVGNKASEYEPDLNMPRTEGSYIYEEFMDVDNAEDVKVYTVGDQFVHAETRKSPVVDGLVRRNTDGKEIRYVTQLTPEEKKMAVNICKVFGQRVCGFDLLRVGGKSYVIDVNGWSFVKGNNYYYNNCAAILQETFLRNARQRKLSEVVLPKELSVENAWRLKAFVSVFRHADRTPKQKMKFSFSSAPFRELLNGGGEEVIIRQARDLKLVSAAAEQAMKEGLEDTNKLMLLKNILDKKSNLPGTKVQVKPTITKDSEGNSKSVKLKIIVKWGGEFTHAAKYQSRDLGDNLRKDLLIMNKHVLDDVKIFTSSERRVRATAELFTQRFLDIREVPKDMLLIRKEMLDDSNAAKEKTDLVKKQLHDLLLPENAEDIQKYWPKDQQIDPGRLVQDMIVAMRKLRKIMRKNFETMDVASIQKTWCCYESPSLFLERWEKIFEEFVDGERADFDPSKVSELYDSLKYDALHNRVFLESIFKDTDSFDGDNIGDTEGLGPIKDLYTKAKILFDFVSPLEYGISEADRLEIGLLTSLPLIKQIVEDLEAAKRSTTPCTRLYFTKESHVHTLLNIVYLSGIPTRLSKNELPELDYLTQITFELYERSGSNTPGAALQSPQPREYSLRIGFSPGAGNSNILDLQMDSKHCLSVMPRRNLTDHLPLEAALRYYKTQVGNPKYKSVNRKIRESRMLGHKLVVANEGEEDALIHDEAPLMVFGSPVGFNGVETHFPNGAHNSSSNGITGSSGDGGTGASAIAAQEENDDNTISTSK
ncbi:histidine phosphatase superfamily-domain-containing protein [Lobosporangium transversale]|uniref:Inositol hexakisphosphate and diphosphoinositol-pentakisphosphate kinase n=1 Tax=Lobosporangium transversale TaxID=64571 RepID=A0A1Y2GLE5_9FUNG|nr:histidine phosphatase superfamily-domain-containing protein [Lobosporangium transversale]ORZ14442.1 histidine phosphatase superfamily-domain-containing protein [Lobosporangium transversale]|eukprot:XP_021880920.1 histidine phosphatase superfamily-domain-containing protein [Lobosporangium transversale]